MSDELISAKTLADETGLSIQTIRNRLNEARAEGRIDYVHDPLRPKRFRWPKDEALAIVTAEADPARIAGHAASGLGNVDLVETSTLSKARAAAETERARKLALANEKAAGNLVALDEVKQAGADVFVHLRAELLAVPARAAPRLMGLTDRLAIMKVLDEEIRAALGDASDLDKFTDRIVLGIDE